MPSNTITLALEGEVSLKVFAAEARSLHELIGALTSEVARTSRIEWVMEDARAGSLLATFEGRAPDSQAVERVAAAYISVGKALQANRPVPYSDRAAHAAHAIIEPLGDKITSVRFETADDDATIVSKLVELPSTPRQAAAYGAVEGRIQTLTNRGSLRFTLYDTLNDKAVTCYLRDGEQDRIVGAWGRRVVVEGVVTRDPVSGRAVNVRDVRSVQILDEVAPGSYRGAMGVDPFEPNAPLPEAVIRRLRDAW